MIYVVLGVGFSGTTLVSEIMHHSGIKMIDEENDNYDNGGKYENPDFQNINKSILNLTNEMVFNLRLSDSPSEITDQQKKTIIQLIDKQNNRYNNWGFKDPRTIVTYNFWSRYLPAHKVVAIYRDPSSNWPRHRWHGLRKRYSNAWRAYIHLRQWYEYNELLIINGKKLGGNFLLLNYDDLMKNIDELNKLQNFIEMSVKDMRKPNMHRSKNNTYFLFTCVRWFMQFTPYPTKKMLEQLELFRENNSFLCKKMVDQ